MPAFRLQVFGGASIDWHFAQRELLLLGHVHLEPSESKRRFFSPTRLRTVKLLGLPKHTSETPLDTLWRFRFRVYRGAGL